MSFKLSQLAIVLAVVTVSSQERIVTGKLKSHHNLKSNQINLHHGVDFDEVLKHLNEHSSDHHQSHHAQKPTNEVSPNLVNIQNLNLHFGPKLLDKSAAKSAQLNLKGCNNGDCNVGKDDDDIGNEFQQLLNELEVELDNVNDYQEQDGDLRCGCQDSSEEENDRKEQQLRCGGNKCGKGLRCGCQPRSEARDENEEQQQLRCGGNKCGKGLRCGCQPRSEDSDEGEEQQQLRCGCRPRSEDRDEGDDREEQQQLRCAGNKCGRSRAPGRSENELKSELEKYGKKYKINKDLDAIVLDLTNFHGLLERLNKQSNSKRKLKNINKRPKDDDNFDMDYMFSVNSNTRTKKNKRTPLVINLSKYEDDETMVKEVENILQRLKLNIREEEPVRQTKLIDYIHERRNRIYRNALNYVQSKQDDNNLKYLTVKQRHQLQELRAVVHKLGARSDESKVEEMVKKILLGKVGESGTLSHLEEVNNPNLPRWLHKVVKDSSYHQLRVKQLLPLTPKQKLKLSIPSPSDATPTPLRRSARNAPQYGVPFEMQVEGLGQLLS